jgi:hypothetical protein
MRLFAGLLVLSVSFYAAFSGSVSAQEPGGAPAGRGGEGGRGGGAPANFKNLKLLTAKSNVMLVMRGFNEALGVQCTYCHVQGDFASDDNPKKDIARKMIAMGRVIDDSFPSAVGVFPEGYHEVDCLTCHRGSAKPATVAPKKFYNLQNVSTPENFVQEPGVSLKILPVTTRLHGPDSVMGDFRDALNVDCNYCHGGGKPFRADVNPRKDIARKMILLVRSINANFPGTGVFPDGTQDVTCYTCHRGDAHPVSVGNRAYELKK